jgi:chaperonin GroEL
VVPGGGLASLRAGDAAAALKLDGDEAAGARTVAKALEAPLQNISRNAGFDPSIVLAEVRERGGNVGLDASTGEYVDLVQAGILDAAKVTRCALQNAASVSSMLLTSKTVIVDIKEKKKAVAGALK